METSPAQHPGGPSVAALPAGTIWRRIAAAGILAAGLGWVVLIFALSLTDRDVAGRDYIQYWAEGRQVLLHANPYDARAILRLEQSAGPGRNEVELSGSPPLVLLLAVPMGLFSARTGLILWFAVLFAALSVSLWLLWLVQGRPHTLIYLFGFLFAPVVACLQCGQISILLLLSLAAFLNLVESRPWLAGVVLIAWLLKPHLFLPFAVALVLWIFARRAYGVAAGFVLALGICLAAIWFFDPRAWTQYLQMMKEQRLIDDFVPTLSVAGQRLVGAHQVWLRFVPDAAACIWAAWYFRDRRHCWNLTREGMVTLLVSFLCAPYGFFFDESILLPAVLFGVLRAREHRRSPWPILVAGTIALIECVRFVPVTSLFYLWTTPAWALWYFYATGNRKKNELLPAISSGAPQELIR
jgi:hypothetical protein